MTKIAIIIPTYNRKDFLEVLLKQLYEQKSLISKYNIEIVVIVDGSTDGTLEMLENEFPDVHIINGTGEWWYTKSMNEGFKYSLNKIKADYFLTLNDDIELGENYLEEIIKSINTTKGESIIGSLSLTKEKPYRVTSSGVYKINKFIGKSYTYYKFLEKVSPEKLTGIHKTLILPGRGMLIPSDILIKLNFFDEKFPQYHSDSDFCLRAIKKGYKIFVNWDAKIYSYYNLTSKSSSYLKKTFLQLLKSFIDIHSRNHVLQNFRVIWRHNYKFCFPFIASIFFITRIRSFLRQYYNYV